MDPSERREQGMGPVRFVTSPDDDGSIATRDYRATACTLGSQAVRQRLKQRVRIFGAVAQM